MSQENPAISRFRDFIRIKSVHPNPDYDGCIEFIKRQGEEIGLEYREVRFDPPGEFTVWLTWRGSNEDLQSIMLNSHIDVVPVDETKWKHPPFSAYKDEQGNIFGRGTQDMKSVGMQYLEAIRNLKSKGFKPKRTVHVTFVPDEELGGSKGMKLFVKSPEFKKLNVGFGLDEGGACPTEEFLLFNVERTFWQVRITAKGNTGHALHFIENTAAEKARKIMNAFLNFRESEKAKLDPKNGGADLGNVTTVNMTMIQGGVQANVIAPEITLTFDFRFSPTWSQGAAEEFIERVCKEAGEEITLEYLVKGPLIPATLLNPDNKWWTSFEVATKEQSGITIVPLICPGATDARYLRELGIPSLGFSPMNNTPILLHDNNEFVNSHVYLKGIEIYENIIKNISVLED